jgi:hypothetical protein
VNTPPPGPLDETSARQVLMLRAFEDGADDPSWTADDRHWATRAARASPGVPADPARFVAERARHAMQRLRPRDATLARWLDARFAVRAWLPAALALGLAAGALVDQIGAGQRINLLAPPIWLLVLWNLLVYAVVALQLLTPARRGRGLRQRLAALWMPRQAGSTPLQRHLVDWMQQAAPLNAARAALLLHGAAAALALGVMAGLYLRGLVLDYRVGWQSTFLEPATVHRLLALLLAPAAAVTGLAVPGADAVAALRVGATAEAQGPAAVWLHLYAGTLALFVVVPRALLAAAAAWRQQWLSRHWPLPWHEPYFQGLLRLAEGRPTRVWLLPHAAAPDAAALQGLRALVAAAAGPETPLQVAEPVGLGNEDDAARVKPPAGTTLVLVLCDLASTPEAEAQGLLLATLVRDAPGVPCLLVVDEAAFQSRFAQLPQRLAQRRQAWQQLADAHQLPLLALDLSQPAPSAAASALLRRLLGL